MGFFSGKDGKTDALFKRWVGFGRFGMGWWYRRLGEEL